MNGSLRAALVLTLKDELTGGLERMKGVMSSIRDLGRSLTLGRLGQEGGDILRNLSSQAQGLVGHLRAIVTSADGARAALGRMGAATAAWGRSTFGKQSKIGAFGATAEAASFIEPIREYASFENIARHSAITEGLSGKPLEVETQRLMAMFQKDALATSQSSESIAQAYQDLIQTGMAPKLAEKLLPIHSRAATAYNIDPEALGHAVAALQMNLGIGENDMGGALASMALAAKSGRFKVEDFSRFLPGITGNMAKLGMTGRGSADTVFAALETVMKNSADPSTGATNFGDFMNYLTSPMAARSFALQSKGMAPQTKAVLEKYHITGIDMPQLLANARTEGVDPISAVLGTLQKKLVGLPPDVMAEVLGSFFHNQQARDAALAMLQHAGDMVATRAKLNTADPAMLNRDFTSANAAPQKKLDLMMEQLAQLGRTAGAAFLPILMGINWGLSQFISLLDSVDKVLPGAKNGVLLAVGALLSLGAVIGAVGAVAPAFAAGWAILSGVLGVLWPVLTSVIAVLEGIVPALAAIAGVSVGVVAAVLVLVAIFIAAAYDIYANWAEFRGFFTELWEGIKNIFGGFLEFLGAVFTGNLSGVVAGLRQMWTGLGQFFGGLWGIIRTLFSDFGSWVDGWTGGAMTAAVNAIKGAWSGLTGWFAALWADIRKPFDDFVNSIVNSPVGHLMGLHAAPQLAGPRAAAAGAASGDAGDGATAAALGVPAPPVTGHITVGVDPNNGRLQVTHAETSAPGWSLGTGMPDAVIAHPGYNSPDLPLPSPQQA